MRSGFAALLFTAGAAACLGAAAADAASCREELQQLEDRLNESSLAADDPEKFAELARAAEDAGELRDEPLCLQRVAELNAALAAEEDETARPRSDGSSAKRAPPKPPLLLHAAPADPGDEPQAAHRGLPIISRLMS